MVRRPRVSTLTTTLFPYTTPFLSQFVKLCWIAAARPVAAEIGGADRLMRFLRVLRLGRILAGAVGQILLVETVADRLARRRNGFAGHLYAIDRKSTRLNSSH